MPARHDTSGKPAGDRQDHALSPDDAAGSSFRWRAYLPTILIFILLLSATAVATIAMLAAATDRTRMQFDDRLTAFEALLTEAMRSYQQALRAGVAVVNSVPDISHTQWQAFVRDLSVEDFYPGIRAIGYVKRLQPDQIDAFVARQRQEGRPNYRFRPEGERDTYTAIVYLAPDDERTRRAVGYDLSSEPQRRAAMEEARDGGRAALSRKVTISRETGLDIEVGVLMFMPVYAGGTDPGTVAGRRVALDGYVYGSFRMADFVVRVVANNLPETFQYLHINIFDGKDTAARDLLFDDRVLAPDRGAGEIGSASRPKFEDQRTINVAGREWTIVARSQPALEATVDRTLAWMTLLCGGLISVLISSIFAQLAYAGERYARAEQRLSAEVTERKRAEDEVKLANRELIHRVKNMLAIVTAIASQTARYSPTVADFNTSFRERLTALARVHDLLRPDPAHAPDLGSFVKDILDPYCGERKEALSTQGPPAEVSRNEAVLLSLLINELGTNATKYGAWSVPDGRVSLVWRLVERDDARELEIIWQEIGGPPVSEPTVTGFGTNVMKFAIERGLRGRIATSFDPAGIRHEIHLPRVDQVEDDNTAQIAEEP